MDPEKTTDLIRGLFSDTKELAAAHVDGLRIEMREEVASLKKSAELAAISVATFAVAAIVLAGAATTALQLALPAWASHLIVAFVLGGIGAAAVAAVKKRRLPPITEPEKAARDAKWVARRTQEAVS